MQTGFHLASVHGMLYTGGNVCFSNDGRQLYSPVSNYVTQIQLQHDAQHLSFPCSNSKIQCIDISPDGDLLLAIGENRGLGFFYSISARVVLDTISFPPNCSIRCARFSPCGRYIAIALENTLQIYTSPAVRTVSYHGCHRIENRHAALTLPITNIEWTPDSAHLLVSGEDARMKIYPRTTAIRRHKGLAVEENALVGHRSGVVGAWFLDSDCTRVLSVSNDNVVMLWKQTAATRKEVLHAIARAAVKARTRVVGGETGSSSKKSKRSDRKNKNKNKKKSDDDNEEENEENEEKEEEEDEDEESSEEEDEEEDDDDEEDEEEESSEDDEEDEESNDEGVDDVILPSFLEKQRAQELALHGVRVADVDDLHLPNIIRYAFELERKHLLAHKGNVSVACFHRLRSLVAIGYNSGIFAIHSAAGEGGELSLVHLLSITAQSLTACAFSPSGDHVAFGSEHLKQLVVWDWRAENYVLKEQSHYYDIVCTAITPDASSIISGGDDGKVKVWKASTGQCYVTFAEHTAGITGIATSQATNAFFTCSSDGTARGYDLVRYRHFRVYTPPDPTQLSCIAVDPSGEVLAVGSSRVNHIILFSVQTGHVIEALHGHESPIACLAFHPSGSHLASGSLDKNIIMWDLFTRNDGGDRLKGDGDVTELGSEVLCIAFSHSGRRMAVLTLRQEITVYDTILPAEPQLIATFNTSFDATGGWRASTNVGPNSANSHAHFTTIAFSPEGERIVAAGESKWIVMYSATQGYALKKWPVTTNMDVQGAEEQYQWRAMSEAGNIGDIDIDDDDIHLSRRNLLEMPGSRHKHYATGKRKTQLTARTAHIAFAPTGTEFVAATSDGLLIFSTQVARQNFHPLQLRRDVTVSTVREQLSAGHPVMALMGALLLGDRLLIVECLRKTPEHAIPVAVSSTPSRCFGLLVQTIAAEVERSAGLKHALLWAQSVLLHSNAMAARQHHHASNGSTGTADGDVTAVLKGLQRSLHQHQALSTLARENYFSLKYLADMARKTGDAPDVEMIGDSDAVV